MVAATLAARVVAAWGGRSAGVHDVPLRPLGGIAEIQDRSSRYGAEPPQEDHLRLTLVPLDVTGPPRPRRGGLWGDHRKRMGRDGYRRLSGEGGRMAETSGRETGRDEPSRQVDAGVTRQERGAIGASGARPPIAPGTASRSRVPSAPGQRPWVGPRFVRGLLIAVPLGIALWALIAWAVSLLF